MYPKTEDAPNGKLRVLYECFPMVSILELNQKYCNFHIILYISGSHCWKCWRKSQHWRYSNLGHQTNWIAYEISNYLGFFWRCGWSFGIDQKQQSLTLNDYEMSLQMNIEIDLFSITISSYLHWSRRWVIDVALGYGFAYDIGLLSVGDNMHANILLLLSLLSLAYAYI